MPALKRTNETAGYDLSTTGTIVTLETDELLSLGWIVKAGSAADFVVEIRPDQSTNYYEIDSYSAATNVDDGVVAPEAFRVRIRNTSTVNDTADAVLGGADQ